jgi:hypothetical protein
MARDLGDWSRAGALAPGLDPGNLMAGRGQEPRRLKRMGVAPLIIANLALMPSGWIPKPG